MTVTASDINGMMTNVLANFFDNSTANPVNMARIRPVNAGNSNDNSLINGYRNDQLVKGPYWMMANMLNLMTEYSLAFPTDTAMAFRIAQQAAYLTNTARVNGEMIGYTDDELKSNGLGDGTINVSDDAAWKMHSFVNLHRITGDSAWLTRLQTALPKILALYADPNAAIIDGGDGVKYSAFGIEYALSTQDANGQERSTLYEATLVQAALYVYKQTNITGFLNYATYMANVWKTYFKDRDGLYTGYVSRNPGAYWSSIHLKDSDAIDGTPLHQPLNQGAEAIFSDGYRHPTRGSSGHDLGGMLAVGVVNAQLYQITRSSIYLDECTSIVHALVDTKIFLNADGTILNDQDPWTSGYSACRFVRDVLSLRSSGVDPLDAGRNAFIATAQYILSNSFSGGFYRADWGQVTSPRNGLANRGYSTWQDQGAASHSGHGGDVATAPQIMTTTSSATMALAGYLCGTLTGNVLVDGSPSQTLTDNNGLYRLVDA